MRELAGRGRSAGTARCLGIALAATLASLAPLLTACGSTAPSAPDPLPPQTLTEPFPAPAADSQPAVEPPVAAPPPRSEPIVLDAGEPPAVRSPTLVEAAAAERARRSAAGEPLAVITDETLARVATGHLTTASGPPPPAEAAATADPAAVAGGPAAEEYWRRRALAARLRWRDAVDRAAALEREIADLRHRFYGEDDPYYRDARIKPAWDRALDRLRAVEEAARLAEAEVASLIEEGRQSGALPGWLREGIELEPPAPAVPAAPAEPGEPMVLDEEPPP